MSLQRYAGSYHANTRIGCYIGSMGISAANAYCLKYLIIDSKLLVILVMCSLILINILAPVENKNNILDILEKRVYKRRTLIISLIYFVMFIGFLLVKKEVCMQIIAQVLLTIFSLQVLGKLIFCNSQQ